MSSGGAATTGCTNVTFSGHAVTAGTLSCCNREVMKLLAAAALLLGLSGATASAPTLAGCPLFPASSPWNQKIDQLPVAGDSAQLIASMGVDGSVQDRK